MLRSALLRSQLLTPSTSASPLRLSQRAFRSAIVPVSRQPSSRRHAHAISNPTLANIEKRWEAMPPQEQADLWMALRDRMKEDWTALTVQEKKAGTCRIL